MDKLKGKMEILRKLDFFLQKVEENIQPSLLELMKVVSDTDKFPRLVWDGQTVIMYASPSFLEMTGYRLEDLIGKPFFNSDGTSDFITPSSIEESVNVVIHNAKNGVKMTKGIINKWFTKNGTEIEIEWHTGFNDPRFGIGSCQCVPVTPQEK